MPEVVTRAEYTEKVERLLEDAKKRFQELELEQMRKGEVEARAALAKAQKRFEERRRELESELNRARKSSDSAWDEIRDGLESAWEEVVTSVNHARDEFRGEVKAGMEDDKSR
ncbi:MAG TPA: hypothetical protein VLA43_02575 [Longimicrobiales bacterium]|nr:hypothetical protein [Longimicrobiales bacterium]